MPDLWLSAVFCQTKTKLSPPYSPESIPQCRWENGSLAEPATLQNFVHPADGSLPEPATHQNLYHNADGSLAEPANLQVAGLQWRQLSCRAGYSREG